MSQQQFETSANANNWAVARNAISGYGAWVVNLAIGLLVTPILLRSLGVEAFGAWTLALATASYVGMVELGLGTATVRRLAASLATEDATETSTVAASARVTYWVLASVGTIVLAGVALVPGLFSGTPEVSSVQLRLTVFILGTGYLATLATSVYSTIAIGAGRADLSTIVGTAFRIITAGAQIAVVLASDSLALLALTTATGTLLGMLAVRTMSRRVFAFIDVKVSRAQRKVCRELMSSGWRNAIIGITWAVAIQSDVLVIGLVLGPAEAAAYGIAVRSSVMVGELAFRATNVLVPTFSHTAAVEDDERTVVALHESAFIARAILTPALVAFLIFGIQLLDLWLGQAPPQANAVLVLLVVCAIVRAPGHSCVVLLTGMNRLTFLVVGLSVAAIGNLALSILLTWKIGILGPVLGSLVAFVVFDLILLPRHVASMLGISWPRLSSTGALELAAPAAAAAAVGIGARVIFGWSTPSEGLVGSIIVGLVYLATLALVLPRARRERYRRVLGGAPRANLS
jgi:O-antigen/teichoic acid export membrane protein